MRRIIVGRLRADPNEVAAAVPRPADPRHQFLSRRRDLRGARSRRHAAPVRRQGRPTTAVRVWVAGCATGEEAYSLAILLREHTEHAQRPAESADFRHRHRRGGDRVARGGPLSRAAGEGRLAGAAGRASSPTTDGDLPGPQGGAGTLHLLHAQRDPRSAVLPHRSDLLPEPADLPRYRIAGPGHSGIPLCAWCRTAICCWAARRW